MSIIGVIIYSLTFLTYMLYFGGYEAKLHLSHSVALGITIFMTLVLLGDIIFERMISRKKTG